MTGASFVSLAKEKNADIVLKGESIEPQKTESDWHEAKSKDGHSYYYHKDTKGIYLLNLMGHRLGYRLG